jgi:ubiquinone biosynthesis protein
VNLLEFGRGPRKVQRLTEIAAVLVRHGLSYFVRRLNLSRYLPRRKQIIAEGQESLDQETLARRLTLAMEDLGPTFVRLGQILSSRPDLVSEEFVQAFQRLQDHVAPFPSEVARASLEREFGRPVEELFASFDDSAAASGSLAQVHYATLPDGTEAVVKVKRPGVERTVMTDLSLLRTLAGYAERTLPELQVLQPRMIVDELERTMRHELDFVTEASNTARFRDALAACDGTACPEVFWDLTSSDVMTMERFRGVRITDPAALDAPGTDRRALARRLLDVFLTQYLELGAFHADPHPGNLLLLDGARIGIIDFGQVGRLTSELRDKLGALLVAIARRDADVVSELCFSLGLMGEDFDEGSFKVGVLELFDKYYGMPLKRIDPRRIFGDVMALARESQIVLPRDLVLLSKSLVTILGIAQQLDPDFDVAAQLRPRAKAVLQRRLAPAQLFKSLGLNLWSLGTLARALPRSLLHILRRAETGRLQLTFRHTGYEDAVSELDRAANRVSLSLILASIIVGSSVLLTSSRGPTLFGTIHLGTIGFVLAGLLGLWTVWGILRSGRL